MTTPFDVPAALSLLERLARIGSDHHPEVATDAAVTTLVTGLRRHLSNQESAVARYKDREAVIIAAVEPADAGQYRHDIASAIVRVTRERNAAVARLRGQDAVLGAARRLRAEATAAHEAAVAETAAMRGRVKEALADMRAWERAHAKAHDDAQERHLEAVGPDDLEETARAAGYQEGKAHGLMHAIDRLIAALPQETADFLAAGPPPEAPR